VLVTGASGGVGSAVIQLAKARGTQVIGITSPFKIDKILSLGSDRTLARNASLVQELGKSSVNVVIDLVAGKQWLDLLDVLKPFEVCFCGCYCRSARGAGCQNTLPERSEFIRLYCS